MTESKSYSIEEVMKAQSALRSAAGLEAEQFRMEAFVGMISDEIEVLREQGKTDDQIAGLIREHSSIEITSTDIAANYASSEQRNQHQF